MCFIYFVDTESKLKKGMQERAKKRKRIQELSSDEEKQSGRIYIDLLILIVKCCSHGQVVNF